MIDCSIKRKERNMTFIVYMCTVQCFLHVAQREWMWCQDTGLDVVQPLEHLRIKRLMQELKKWQRGSAGTWPLNFSI